MQTTPDTESPTALRRAAGPARAGAAFRTPNYDCRDQRDSLMLLVYLPGVSAGSVQIEAHGPDLVVTAQKERFVRPNWQSFQIEAAQQDYRLRLRLGHGFDFGAMEARIDNGILRVLLPKLGTARTQGEESRVKIRNPDSMALSSGL